MRRGRIVILSGPSGSGKTTLYQKILQDAAFKNRLVRSVSCTTRRPRPGERNGADYFFVSEKKFLYKIRAGHFLEYERVVGNYYGTPRRNVRDILKTGRHVLLCIDVNGARQVSAQEPDALKIFITPPSLDILSARLRGRGSEDPEAVALRLETAAREMTMTGDYPFVIENDDLETAYGQLRRVLAAELQLDVTGRMKF